MSDSKLLPTVEHETGDAVGGSVVWLHGLGADGHDFEPIVPELRVETTALRFVFPHAPVRPVTLNGGMAMRAWFDILGLERSAPQDEAGIRRSAEQTLALIRRERERGIPDERIVLAGFSQGGAIALHAGLRHDRPLAGILALSTYLPLQSTLAAEAHEANRSTPLMLAHGLLDPVVPCELGEASQRLLVDGGYDVAWKTYPMPHAVCPEEIADVRAWLGDRFVRRS